MFRTKENSTRTRFLSTLEVFAVKTRDYERCMSEKKNERYNTTYIATFE
jgi:hypothetical protein